MAGPKIPEGPGSYASHKAARERDRTGPQDTPNTQLLGINASLMRLETIVETLAAAVTRSDVSLPQPPKPRDPDPEETLALTRTLRKFKAGTTILLLISSVLGVLASNLWSYVRGYGDDRAERAIESEELMRARKQISEQQDKLAKAEEARVTNDTRRDAQLVAIANLQLLEFQHIYDVFDALARKQRIPDKPSALIEAERAVSKIHDGPGKSEH